MRVPVLLGGQGARHANSSGLLNSCGRKEPPAGKVGSGRVGKAGRMPPSLEGVEKLGAPRGLPWTSQTERSPRSGSQTLTVSFLLGAQKLLRAWCQPREAPEAHACPRSHCTASGIAEGVKERASLGGLLILVFPESQPCSPAAAS